MGDWRTEGLEAWPLLSSPGHTAFTCSLFTLFGFALYTWNILLLPPSGCQGRQGGDTVYILRRGKLASRLKSPTSNCSHFCASLLATPPCSHLWPVVRESMGSWPVFAEEAEVVTEVTVNLNCSYFSMLFVSAVLNSLLQNCLDQGSWHSRWHLPTSQAS